MLYRLATVGCTLALLLAVANAAPKRHRRQAACSDIKNCETCANPDLECVACMSQQVLSGDKLVCIDCPPNCHECSQVTMTDGSYMSECTVCVSGFTLTVVEGQTAMQCLDCAGNCRMCDVNGQTMCDEGECYPKYRFNANTMKCDQCTAQCNKCDGSEAGLCDSGSCDARYALVSGLCKTCGANCKKCSVENECDSGECDDLYVLNAATRRCEPCGGFCMKCSVPNKCDAGQCIDGYALSTSSECQTCAGHCMTCSTPGLCDTDKCDLGYTLNSDKGCTSCQANCKHCTIDTLGVTTCTTCLDTFQKISNTTCDMCPENCEECEVVNGQIKCKNSRCSAKYALNINDGTCHACPAKCNSCTYQPSSKKTMCQRGQCEARYVDRLSDGKCYKCPDFCSKCTDDGTDVYCIYPYCDAGSTYNFKTKKCSACPDQCMSCYIDVHEAVACSSCSTLYALSMDYKSCKKCPNNCNMCYDDNGNSKCYDEQCRTGYYFDSTDSQCKDCSITGCLMCGTDANGQRICLQCNSDYAMTTDSKCSRCSDCKPGSCVYDTTSSTATCTECNESFTANSNGGCIGCPSRCTNCQMDGSSTTVTLCNNGGCQSDSTYVDSKTCVACPDGCNACSYTQNAVFQCTSCMTGYRLRFGVCHSCPPNCAACDYSSVNGRTQCTTCSTGYTVSSNKCLPCGTACTTCNTNGDTKCDGSSFCSTGYVYSSTSQTCVQCMRNCDACNTETTCTTCKTGYTYVTNADGTTSCEACADKDLCTSCSSASTCSTCKMGYVINTDGNSCLECPTGCAYCDTDSNSPVCKFGLCHAGYVMDKSRRCRQCPVGCANCYIGEGDVTKCFMGHCKQGEAESYTQASDGTCMPCPSDCIHCHVVGSETVCDQDGCINNTPMVREGSGIIGSFTGPLDNAGRCELCDMNCDQCSTKEKCDVNKCKSTFYSMTTDSTTNTCADCDMGCATCQVDGASGILYCLTCEPLYALDDMTANAMSNCSMCDLNCGLCTANGIDKCDTDQCDSMYYLQTANDTCQGCGSGCQSCTDGVTCTLCSDNFHQSASCGVQCETNCMSCDSSSACTACMLGYGDTPSSENCTMCGTGCDECTVAADLTTTCTLCKQEFYLDLVTGVCHRVACSDSMVVPTTTAQWEAQLGQSIDPLTGNCLGDDFRRLSGCMSTEAVLNSAQTAYASSTCPQGFCRPGFEWFNSACVACPRGCGNCRFDPSAAKTICKVDGCKYKFTRTSTGKCTKCPIGCNECTVDANDKAVCDSGMCDTHFQEVAAKTCLACYDKCQSCAVHATTNMLTCSRCNTGFVNVGTTCFSCSQDCDTCTMLTATTDTSETSCTTCATQFARNSVDNRCYTCPDKCGTCSYNNVASATECQPFQCVAEAGQNPDLLSCHGCPDDCLMCEQMNLDNTQMSCVPGGCMSSFYQYTDGQGVGQCARCVDFCLNCVDSQRCLDQQCMTGYGLNKDGTCTDCGIGCMTCSVDTNYQPTCLVCMARYVLNGVDCVACPDNCRECVYDGTTQTSKCKSGACDNMFCQDSSTSSCIGCPANSLSCEFNTDFSQCSATSCDGVFGYVTSNTLKTCSACSQNCNKCTNNAEVCDECATRYTVVDGTCKTCSSDCFKCTKENECDSNGCDPRFVAHTDETTQKTTCKACSADCMTCDTVDVCTRCDSRFMLVNGACVGCSEHCLTCEQNAANSAIKECTICESHYTINSAKGCSACPGNCDSCHYDVSGKMVCDTCLARYALNDGQCGNCPRNCLTCSVSNGAYRCTKCANLYALEELTGTCAACPANCVECRVVNSEVTCLMCADGHSFDASQQCKSCPSLINNCQQCSDADESGVNFCSGCESGYALQDDMKACLACQPNNCQECRDLPLACSQCSPNYEPSEDGTECGMYCYQCSKGMNCPVDPNAATSTYDNTTWCMGVCKGYGERTEGSNADWVASTEVTRSYGCDNNPDATCSTTAPCMLNTANGIEQNECCCVGSKCHESGAVPLRGSLALGTLALLLGVLNSL